MVQFWVFIFVLKKQKLAVFETKISSQKWLFLTIMNRPRLVSIYFKHVVIDINFHSLVGFSIVSSKD